MKIKYFAWVRERIGCAEEDFDLPDSVTTAADLISVLSARDEGYAAAFETPAVIRVAVDQVHCEHDADIRGAKEVAFFPPMTGG